MVAVMESVVSLITVSDPTKLLTYTVLAAWSTATAIGSAGEPPWGGIWMVAVTVSVASLITYTVPELLPATNTVPVPRGSTATASGEPLSGIVVVTELLAALITDTPSPSVAHTVPVCGSAATVCGSLR